jgi:hypothetical protein
MRSSEGERAEFSDPEEPVFEICPLFSASWRFQAFKGRLGRLERNICVAITVLAGKVRVSTSKWTENAEDL